MTREHIPASQCDHVAIAGVGWTSCPACGSTCKRDRDGTIAIYQRGDKDRPKGARPFAADVPRGMEMWAP